jgi:hypothetical protein
MPTAVLSLEDLAQRIERQTTELTKLRELYEARQAQLAGLTHRKMELQAQLQKVETEIRSIAKDAATTPTLPFTKSTKVSAGKLVRGLSLPKLLVDIIRHSKRPLVTKDLVEAVVQRKYPTTSTNLQAMIETRVNELARKGILKRASDRQGVVLGNSATLESATRQAPVAKKPLGGKNQKKKSLKVVIQEVLANTSRPLNTEELAKQILLTGYQTKSKNFLNVIWVGIGDMANVERVAEGYRLKKGKTSVNKK